MREQIRRLSGDDPTAIEEIARRELGFIRPGERLFIIRDVTPASREVALPGAWAQPPRFTPGAAFDRPGPAWYL